MSTKTRKLTLDDIVFEGRNKEYGVYVLRSHSRRRLFASFGLSLGLFLIMVEVPGIINDSLTEGPLYEIGLNGSGRVQIVPYDPVVFNSSSGSHAATVNEDLAKVSEDEDVPENVKADTTRESALSKADSISGGSGGNSENGRGVAGTGLNGDGYEGEFTSMPDIFPEFPGGAKAMQLYIMDHLVYPESAKRDNSRGVIRLFLVITRDGIIREVKVVQGLQPELDEALVAVIKAMPSWKPAKQAGLPVNVRCILPVTVYPSPQLK